MLISIVKLVAFTKTHLLIVVSRVVKFWWNSINKGIVVEKNDKCCIGIVKWQLFWAKEKMIKRQ